jgi:HEAT repeat protein
MSAMSKEEPASPSDPTPAGRGLDSTGSGHPARLESPDLPPEPLTMGTLGRLFAVPLVIICVIVGGAVVVVLAFGSLTSEKSRSIDHLLTSLEQSTGEPLLGLLAPREKELWQTAMELGSRLRKKDSELTAEDLDEVVKRLAVLVEKDLETAAGLSPTTAPPGDPVQFRVGRLEWLIRALGSTELPAALPPLIRVVDAGIEPYRMTAIAELADLKRAEGAEAAIEPIRRALDTSDSVPTLVVACAALSALAEHGDAEVIEALSRARLSHEGEVAWNASLAMARLGSDAGKLTLLDLLDRSFWEAPDRYQKTDASGVTHRYAMPAERIERFIIAAIDAASTLDDDELRGRIESLTSDPSLEIRRRAVEALNKTG